MEKNPMLEPEYIDRKKLLGKQKTIDGEPYVRLWDALMAPVEDVAPVVHGRWIHDINNLYGCSECLGRETMSHKKLKPYCPNCGAKMEWRE